ncbi:MAG TPA: TolC family protein [Spirochaetia bacterium]|nr:TolC family protein [Spirochaetia bacterium]
MTKTHLCLYLAMLLLLTFQTAVFGEEIVLDIDKAVEMARQNNLGLQSEQISLKMKKRTRDTVWNYFLPVLGASANLSRSNQAPEGFSMLFNGVSIQAPASPHTWNVSFGFNATLTITSQLYFGIRKTFLDYEAGLISLATAEKRLVLDVKKSFYNLILLEKNIELMRQNIATAQRRYEQAKTNYENGQVSEYAMLSAQVALENLKPGLEEMIIGYKSAINAFKQLLGIDRKTDVKIQGSISTEEQTYDKEELIRRYIENRLDIQSLLANIKSLDNLKKITLSGMLPSLTFMYLMDPTFQKDPFRDPWFADPANDWKQRAGMFGITLNVPLNGLIPNSREQIQLADSEDSIRKARIGLAQARQGAELEIESLVMKLDKSVQSTKTLNLNVGLAQRAYDLAEKAYNAGTRELLEVQNAELELQKARLEVLKEDYNYTTGLLDLEYAINTTLKEAGE